MENQETTGEERLGGGTFDGKLTRQRENQHRFLGNFPSFSGSAKIDEENSPVTLASPVHKDKPLVSKMLLAAMLPDLLRLLWALALLLSNRRAGGTAGASPTPSHKDSSSSSYRSGTPFSGFSDYDQRCYKDGGNFAIWQTGNV